MQWACAPWACRGTGTHTQLPPVLLLREHPGVRAEPGSSQSSPRGGRGCPQCTGEAAGRELATCLLRPPALARWRRPHSIPSAGLCAGQEALGGLPGGEAIVSAEPPGEASRGRRGGVRGTLHGEEV